YVWLLNMGDLRTDRMICNDPADFSQRPYRRSSLSTFNMINLLFPERTDVLSGESQWSFDPSNLASLGRARILIFGWSQIKEVFDYVYVNINSLKITARQVVPLSDRLTNAFTRSPL